MGSETKGLGDLEAPVAFGSSDQPRLKKQELVSLLTRPLAGTLRLGAPAAEFPPSELHPRRGRGEKKATRGGTDRMEVRWGGVWWGWGN